MAERRVCRRKAAEARSGDDNPGWISGDVVVLSHPGDDLTGKEVGETGVAGQFITPAHRSDVAKNDCDHWSDAILRDQVIQDDGGRDHGRGRVRYPIKD